LDVQAKWKEGKSQSVTLLFLSGCFRVQLAKICPFQMASIWKTNQNFEFVPLITIWNVALRRDFGK
jgi:hypothetical protein